MSRRQKHTVIIFGVAISLLLLLGFTKPSTSASARLAKIVVMKSANPAECLYANARLYTIEGKLWGKLVSAVPAEDPPVPAHIELYLRLDAPISVCAFEVGVTKIPAYANVMRIGLRTLSVSAYSKVMSKWGGRRILMTGVLSNSSLGSPARPGPILFSDITQFCYTRTEHYKNVFRCIEWSMKESFEESMGSDSIDISTRMR